jgi:NRPS condensation-like uncharacterized protein
MHYKAEIFDRMQWLYEATGFTDHQVHCELGLGSSLDESALRRAVEISLGAIPILATKYAAADGKAAWVSLPPSELKGSFALVHGEAAFESERTYRIREELGPQVRVCLMVGGRNALAVTMNHMVTDGSGFTDYLYFLCDAYSRLLRDPAYGSERVIDGDRGIGPVLRAVGPIAKAASLLGFGGASNEPGEFAFPYSEGGELAPFIATRTIVAEKVSELKSYCRERGATLNDAALAAYYRVLGGRIGEAALTRLAIPIMIDMRRYLPSREFDALRNLSSTAITRLSQCAGESFETTLLKAKAEMDKLKRRRIGLGGFVKLELLFSLLGEREAFRRLGRGLRNPLICMTNVGELDSERLAFAATRVESAYVCGSIKHKPHCQMALSGFAGTITLSSNLYGSLEDRASVDSFLADVEGELSV